MSARRKSASAVVDLAEWRKRKNISLVAIASATKISVRYLEAIEGGNFRALPAGVYTISYLRQYADAINYDADHLIEHYHKVVGTRPAIPPPENTPGLFGRLRAGLRSAFEFNSHNGAPHPRR